MVATLNMQQRFTKQQTDRQRTTRHSFGFPLKDKSSKIGTKIRKMNIDITPSPLK